MAIIFLLFLLLVWHLVLVLWIRGSFGPSGAKAKTILAVECLGIITVCLILLVGRLSGGARVADLTEKKLYTLSGGTLNILGGLKNQSPITLKLYYAQGAAEKGPEQIQFWNQYQFYVRDILEEYVSRSNGKLKLEVIDPRPDSDEEVQAQAAGIRGFPINKEENFYFGLAASNQYGKSKVIDFFAPDRQEFVEYDVSKLISELMQREKRKVGVLSSLPVMGPDNMNPYEMAMRRMQHQPVPEPWTIIQQIGQSYDVVKAVVKDGAIGSEAKSDMGMGSAPQPGAFSEDLNFLIVIHPKNLDEPTKFAIDQFVMKGGKLIVFEDPCCFSDQPESENPYADPGRSVASDLNDLTANWGLAMRANTMAVDRSLASPGQDGNPLLPSLNLNDKCTNTREIISTDLHMVRMFAAGVLDKSGKGADDVQMLLQTSAESSSTWSPSGPIDPRTAMLSEMVSAALFPSKDRLMLAGIIRGKLTTNFPSGLSLPPPPEEPRNPAETKPASQPATKPAKHLPAVQQSPEDAAVVVVADVDMIHDQMAYEKTFFGMNPVGDNAALLLNALDFLSGQKDLISIRSHGLYSRPFTKVDQIEREAVVDSEKRIDEAKTKIQSCQQRLQELGESADEKNVKVISSEKLAKRQEIQNELKAAETDLRHVRVQRRQKVEELRWTVEAWNLFGAPSIILVIAVALAILRRYHAAKWAGRRN